MYMKYTYLTLASFILLFTSCISNKNINIFDTEGNTKLKLVETEYKFKRGDLIHIQISSLTPSDYDFFNKSTFSKQTPIYSNPYLYGYEINSDGYLELPLLGRIYSEKLTKDQLKAKILVEAEKSLVNPMVKITLLNYNISVLGHVQNPGSYNINKTNVNVLDAIAMANGFSIDANRNRIKIIRINDSQDAKVYYLNLNDISSVESSFFYLQSNDIVFIEPLKKRFFAISNLSSAISLLISSLTLILLINQS